MRTPSKLIAISLMLPLLAACGNTKGERALSGGAIGAGAGAVAGALVGGHVAAGAVIGGLAGAATGAITDKDQINFGDIN